MDEIIHFTPSLSPFSDKTPSHLGVTAIVIHTPTPRPTQTALFLPVLHSSDPSIFITRVEMSFSNQLTMVNDTLRPN